MITVFDDHCLYTPGSRYYNYLTQSSLYLISNLICNFQKSYLLSLSFLVLIVCGYSYFGMYLSLNMYNLLY